MNRYETVELKNGIDALINHCIQKHIANYHLNYGLDKNQERLLVSVERVNRLTNKDLIEFEKKVWAIAKDEIAKLPEEKRPTIKDPFGFGLTFVTKKERDQRIKWMADYDVFMKEEDEYKIFYLDPVKVGELDIEYPFYKILRRFYPQEKEEGEIPEITEDDPKIRKMDSK